MGGDGFAFRKIFEKNEPNSLFVSLIYRCTKKERRSAMDGTEIEIIRSMRRGEEDAFAWVFHKYQA